jgi:cytoskeletal protein CcmA (bactofilin family)
LRIIGNLKTDGDIQIDGTIEGDVCSRLLSIGEKAVVNGAIAADTVRIAGTANGEVTARVVQLSGTARVVGDINHQSLSIDAGAYVQGLCRHIEPDAEAPQTSLESQVAKDQDVAAAGGGRLAVSEGVPGRQRSRVKAVG